MRKTPLLLDAEMRAWQALAWLTLAQWNIFLNHRSSGKTWFLAICAAFTLYLSPHAIPIGIFAPSLKKARKLLFSKVRDLLESEATPHIKFLKSEGRIINTQTNASIDFFSLGMDGNATMARGERLCHVYLDEGDECDGREFFETLLPTMQGLVPELEPLKRLIISGTPRGSATLQTQLIAKYQPHSPGLLNDVSVDEILFKEHSKELTISPELQEQLNNSKYRFYNFPVSKTKLISEDNLAAERLLMNKQQYLREYECSLSAVSDETLFAVQDLIAASQTPPAGVNTEPDTTGHINYPELHITNTAPIVAGLDIAGSGDDKMVLAIRQGLSRPLFMHTIATQDAGTITRRNMDKMISEIEVIMRKYHCNDIACDASGIGDYFVERMQDRLHQYNYNVDAVKGQQKTPYNWEGSFYNMRATLIGLASLAVKEHSALPAIPEMMEELQAHIRDDEKQDSRMKVVGKDKIKQKLSGRSPDYSDAWFLTFFYEAQHPLEMFQATLRDVRTGRINLSTSELLDRFPELYQQDNDSNELFEDSILNEEFNYVDA